VAKLNLNPDRVELVFSGIEHSRRVIGHGKQEYLPGNEFRLAAVFMNERCSDYIVINAQTLLENPERALPDGSNLVATRILRLSGVREEELAKAAAESISVTFKVASGQRPIQTLPEIWHAKTSRSYRYHTDKRFPIIPDIERLVFGRGR